MTASTQTTSTGWFYADANPEPSTKGWDGRLWPEIVGYRGHISNLVAESLVKTIAEPHADLSPMFEIAAAPSSCPAAELDSLVQFSYAEPVIEEREAAAPARVSTEEIDDFPDSVEVTESVEVVEPVALAASATMGHIFAILAVILVLVAITLGVVL